MPNVSNNSFKLMGMKLDNIDDTSFFQSLNLDLEKCKKKYVSITNTEAMYIGLKERSHFNYINNSYISLCDGTGLVIAGLINGLKINKYHGPDFFEDVISEGLKYGWTHYFLGGKEDVTKSLKNQFQSRFKNVKILGYYSPPFRELSVEEEIEMINKINELQPNFLWVSLGLPKQENWIAKYINRLDVNFAVGVGAAFDFHTGNVKRAPKFFQKIGLEWLYRTMFERRLIIRQIRGFKFMFKAIFNQFIK